MRKQKENPQLNIEKEKFIIFQFVKLEGIRGKEKYKSDRFVSPIFGRSVKDVVTVPFTVKDTGDTTRRFDAFRTKAKLSEEEAKEKYGNKYYEFTNIVSNKTRTEYFGESNYVPTNEKEKEEVKERTIIKPIARNYREPVQKEQESPFKAYQEPKRVAHVPPVMNEKKIEQEPVVETYKRRAPIEAKDIVTSDFGSNQDLDDVLQDEVRKPQREIYKPKEESYIYPSIKIFSKKQR
ncbi:MAG: hypothetical protein RG740_03445, partial [Acholeplasmataceae bacterium]|nr:hypothetical protein [Acholeplasmataceae bacterium]